MIGKKEILAITKQVIKRDKGIPDRKLLHPGRDWSIGLMIASMLFMAVTLYAGYMFLALSKNINESATVESSVIEYEREGAQKVLHTYRKKISTFKTLRADRSNVSAPILNNEEEEKETDDEETPEVLADDLNAQ